MASLSLTIQDGGGSRHTTHTHFVKEVRGHRVGLTAPVRHGGPAYVYAGAKLTIRVGSSGWPRCLEGPYWGPRVVGVE